MKDPVIVRPAVPEDVETISRLELQLYPNPWFPATFRSLLKQERARVLVAEDPARGVVGYAVYWWVYEQAELANLAVAKDVQGRGVGGKLLDRALAEVGTRDVERVFLEVRESNEAARRLYRSRGFSQISIRRDYYRNPREDALILAKSMGSDQGTEDSAGSAGESGGGSKE